MGDRAAHVLLYTPRAASAVREYIDAEAYLPLGTVKTVSAAELGGEVGQTSGMSDFRDVGGCKVPFSISTVNPAQAITITLKSVEHNKPINDAMFSRSAAK